MSLIKDLYDIYKDYVSVTIYELTPEAKHAAEKEQKRRHKKFLTQFLPISWIVLILTLLIITSFATKLI